MRFLHTTTYELVSDNDYKYRERFRRGYKYAILSHRWVQPEILYETHSAAELKDLRIQTAQLNKIRGACEQARKDGLEWLWDDTCCINKQSTAEEARSLNSMFQYYREATICYAYIHDVVRSTVVADAFKQRDEHGRLTGRNAEWFERGWTLQEILAPRKMNFYDRDWNLIGTKASLAPLLTEVTNIGYDYLTGEKDFRETSVATRMSWMAGRYTTEIEDIAYSMLGIFNISMTPQYGEGVQAFQRLQEELIAKKADESIFAWANPQNGSLGCFRGLGSAPAFKTATWGLLAPSPDCFQRSGRVFIDPRKVVQRPGRGYQVITQAVQFDMAAKSEVTNVFGVPRKEVIFPLNCWLSEGGTEMAVTLRLIKNGDIYRRQLTGPDLEKDEKAKVSTNKSMGIDQVITRSIVVEQPVFTPDSR